MRAIRILLAAIGAASAMACGSDGGSSGCKPPVLDGSPFGASGTATLTGTGTLFEGLADGLQLQVAVQQGNASLGVLPENLFAENDSICGKTFQYTVHKLEAGSYRLQVLVFDPNDDSTDTTPKFEGEAPADFTIADGQTLRQDTVFQKVAN